MKQTISILGSTGSIGLNTLKIFSKKKNLLKLNILSANKNYKLICTQIKKFRPDVYIINDYKIYLKVKKKFKKNSIKIFNKIDINNNSIKKSDITIAAIPGIAGLIPLIKMIKKSKRVLIANKEAIICGWKLIKREASINNTKIIPVDSEHFSIKKLLENQKTSAVKRIYLTASGGPFLNHKISKLKYVQPIEAVNHPKWKMGKKISVDSATLMNKVLEVIEAHKFFSIDLSKIKIVIHPESLVHAVIEFNNGLYKFLYHETSMIVPLANAIFENSLNIKDILNLRKKNKNSFIFRKLNFLKVDEKKFPIVKLIEKVNKYESSPIIVNAANEILVDHFLKKKIGFTAIYKYLLLVLSDRNYKKYAIKKPKNITQILKIDDWSRNTTIEKIKAKPND